MAHTLAQGEALFNEGRVSEAEKCFLALLGESPEDPRVLNNLGVIQYTRGKEKEAEHYFSEALSLGNDYPDALLNLAELYLNRRQWNSAANLFERYTLFDNKNATIFNQLAMIYLETGKAEKARKALIKSLELDPTQRIVSDSPTQVQDSTSAHHVPGVKRKDKEILKDYAEFSGIPIPELFQRMDRFHHLVNQEWEMISADNWDEKAGQFYKKSDHYVLDLLTANPDLETIENKLADYGVWNFLEQLPAHMHILEFGGGLGGACQLFHERGHNVTYLDIPGIPMDFAKWRFQKYRLPIDMIESNPGLLTLQNHYDFIFSDAVFEHLIHPVQVASELFDHLQQGGHMLILIDTFNLDEDWPMHRTLDFDAMDRALEERGAVKKLSSENRMINLWYKD